MVKIPVAIVDDKRIIRNTIAEQLTYSGRIDILFEASDGEDFLLKMKSLRQDRLPHVVLMDLEMPILNGIATVAIASEIYKETSFLMLTVFDDDDKVFEAIKAGAAGYILKEDKVNNIIDAIFDITVEGNIPLSPKIAHKIIGFIKNIELLEQETSASKHQPTYNLSARELEILSGITEGLNYHEIGEKLFISPHTVRKHISNIYKKLHVSNKASAIKIAVKENWF